MSIYTEWYDKERNILLQTHAHNWTWEDLLDHHTHVLPGVLANATGTTALIIDMTEADWLPESEEFVKHIQTLGSRLRFCNVDITMFVLSKAEIGSLLALAYRQFAVRGRKYYFTETVEDACSVIFEHRGIGERLKRQ